MNGRQARKSWRPTNSPNVFKSSLKSLQFAKSRLSGPEIKSHILNLSMCSTFLICAKRGNIKILIIYSYQLYIERKHQNKHVVNNTLITNGQIYPFLFCKLHKVISSSSSMSPPSIKSNYRVKLIWTHC